MSLQHLYPPRLRRPLWHLAMALGLAACARPSELAPAAGAGTSRALAAAPWQAQLAVATAPDASRLLTDGEGEVLVASAIAAHERRRP
ncbi:MAG TPA: hypothetical protein VG758_07425 [Hyphomicrobiaceae bacterium]|nr:hypothetical protein [Hyphomicrobiaceae bacterium]